MYEQQYTAQPMVDVSGTGMSPLARFLLGLFTGVAAAAPITALITKKICDKNKNKAVEQALIDGENRGIEAMKQVYVEEMQKVAGSAPGAVFVQNKGISEGNVERSKILSEAQIENVAEKAKDVAADIPVYVETAPGVLVATGSQNEQIDYLPVDSSAVNEGGNLSGEAYLASLQSPTDDDRFDYDLENYDLKIDDEEATRGAREFSEEHVRYLDMVNRYKNSGGEIPPMTISREQFENEHFYEKAYINWYEDDDIFEEEDRPVADPGYYFGFTSGRDMFAPDRTVHREDPNICHIRNMQQSTDFEITRMSGSYAQNVVQGEAYYIGETGSQF